MKIKFYSTHILGLPNKDMVTAYINLVLLVDKYLPESLDENHMIITALDKAKRQVSTLQKIERRNGGHELTSRINELHKERTTSIKNIKGLVRVMQTSYDPAMQAAAKKVYPWFKMNSDVLPLGSQDAVSRTISELVSYSSRMTDFRDALYKVVTEEAVEALMTVHSQYLAARDERLALWGDEVLLKVDSLSVKRQAVRDLKVLMGVIETLRIWENEDFDKMFTVLNLELTRISTIYLRARTMRRNNGESESVVEMHTASFASHTYGMNSDFEVPAGSGVADSVEAVDESVPESVAPDDNKEAI